MQGPPKTNSIATNPLAKPKFRGDPEKLVEVVDGYAGLADYLRSERAKGRRMIPWCFSDPNLESGVCNPGVPLDPKKNESHLCALHKACLVAKLLSCSIPCNPFEARERPYEEILADADQLFDQEPEDSTPEVRDTLVDRQTIRAEAHAINLQMPVNPFRNNSVRKLILDILSRDWVSLADLKAIISSKHGIRRLDLILHNVTSIATQEQHAYRIVESGGKFKAFRR